MGPTRARRRRGGGWTCAPSSSACGSSVRGRSWPRRSGAPAAPRSRARASTGRRSVPTTRSSRPGSPPGCSATRTGGSASSVELMALDTAGVDRALGAIGTTFRLTRLYPPSHPAVAEALRQIAETLPTLAALGIVEWKVGVTGLHWQGQHLLPRNTQIAELAGLLLARRGAAGGPKPPPAPGPGAARFPGAVGSIPPPAAPPGRRPRSPGA